MIKIILKTPKEHKDFEKFLLFQIDKVAKELASYTSATVREVINSKIRRPGSTGKLAHTTNWDVEKLPDGYGVGNIDKLNQTAPYWFWLNYGVAQTGRKYPPSYAENNRIVGHFEPGTKRPTASAYQQGRFTRGKPHYRLYPKRPMPAYNYITETWHKLINYAESIKGT